MTPPPPEPTRRGWAQWLGAVLLSAAGLALVVVLYDRGVLPLAGPFALVALLPLLWPLMERGQRAREAREARRAGAPPPPDRGRDLPAYASPEDAGVPPGLRAAWYADGEAVQVDDPRLSAVHDAVCRLDGTDRTAVTVTRGLSRLDVTGDARSRVMVFVTDPWRRPGQWAVHPWHVVDPSASPATQVAVASGGTVGRFPEPMTTTVEQALVALDTWWHDGARDEGLTWQPVDDALRGDPPTVG